MRFSHPRLSLAAVVLVATPLAAQNGGLPSCDAPPRPASEAPASAPTVPIHLYNNHIYLAVCTSGRELEFILDTGSGRSYIDLNLAKRIGVPLGDKLRVGGVGAGSSGAARVSGSVRIAGTGLVEPIDYALDLSGMPSRHYHVLDGILGYDFIVRHVIALDYEKSEMRIYDRRTFKYRGSGVSLPLTLIEDKPNAMAELRLLDGETLRGLFLIDAGYTGGVALSKPFVDDNGLLDRVGATVHPPKAGGLGGRVTIVTGHVNALRLGSAELPGVSVDLFGDSAGLMSDRRASVGVIGGEVLRRFTVYFDYGSKVMILEPHPGIR